MNSRFGLNGLNRLFSFDFMFRCVQRLRVATLSGLASGFGMTRADCLQCRTVRGL